MTLRSTKRLFTTIPTPTACTRVKSVRGANREVFDELIGEIHQALERNEPRAHFSNNATLAHAHGDFLNIRTFTFRGATFRGAAHVAKVFDELTNVINQSRKGKNVCTFFKITHSCTHATFLESNGYPQH